MSRVPEAGWCKPARVSRVRSPKKRQGNPCWMTQPAEQGRTTGRLRRRLRISVQRGTSPAAFQGTAGPKKRHKQKSIPGGSNRQCKDSQLQGLSTAWCKPSWVHRSSAKKKPSRIQVGDQPLYKTFFGCTGASRCKSSLLHTRRQR